MLLGLYGSVGYGRLLTLSDGIFAIAITLLVLNFKTPASALSNSALAHGLLAQGGALFAYALTVAVVGRYWIGHHQMFQYIRGFDAPLAMLNFAFLGAVAFLPYPTSVLSQFGGTTSIVFYASANALCGVAQLAVWVYAWRFNHPRVVRISDDVGRLYAFFIARVPAAFLISIPVAFASPTAAQILWFAFLLPGVVMRRRRRDIALRAEELE